ncbi:hypothetical protein B0H12DRAFT_1327254 [Mycena haematopus]|nr:hypothetical protein B0H12DRAFT_1327254 [Mycena haematopus]
MPISGEILPAELWDLVLQHLDQPLRSLLTLATVCQSFNRLCIQRYLLCNGVPADSLAAGNIEINAAHLPALLVSCYTPPIQRLSCTEFADIGSLKLTKRIVEKSLSLREVSLAFPRDLLGGPPDVHGERQLGALCDLIHSMCLKIADGPVILMSGGLFFRCTARDIPHWQLYEVPNEVSKGFWRRPAGIPAYAIVRDRSEQPLKINPIPSLSSISIRCFWFQSCALIVVNPECAHSLYLGTVGPLLAEHSIPGPELSQILPLLTLPALRNVHLHTTTVDPTVLADFLLRHPSVTSLAYEPPETDLRPPVFLSPPIAHPALARIHVSDPIHILAVLDSAGASPALADISLPYIRGDLRVHASAAALAAALRRIALHPRQTTLTLALGSLSRRALDPAECAAAESLQCVVRVVVECASIGDARAVLPWLTRLPVVGRVEFRVGRGVFRWGSARDPQTGTMRFLDDALEVLPRVAEVVVR